MRAIYKLSAIAALALGLSGCATSVPMGNLMTDITLPVTVSSNGGGSKTGIAMCESFLGMIARGDCSLEAAKANGGITKVSHVDWKANNLLGIIGKYELHVHGE